MPRSLYGWIGDIRTQLRDGAGSQNIWSRREIADALINAQREARQVFWVDGQYTSLALSSGNQVYALPPWMNRVLRVERSLLGNTQSALGALPGIGVQPIYDQWQELHDWQQFQEQRTNFLFIRNRYWYGQLRLRYEADLPIFPLEDTLTTLITATAQIIPLTNSGSPAYLWPVPGFAKVEPDGDIFYYEAITQTSFTGVMRGMFGTGVQTATSAFGLRSTSSNIVAPVWMHDGHPSEDFIQKRAIANLLQQRLLDSDVEASRTIGALASQWGTQADMAKRQDGQRHEPRSLHVRRQRRF